MTKQEQIAAKLAKPIQVGDTVEISAPYNKEVTEKVKIKGKFEHVKSFISDIYEDIGTVTQIIDTEEFGLCYLVEFRRRSIPQEIELKGFEWKVSKNLIKAEYVRPNLYKCGMNPFKPRIRVSFFSGTIESLLFYGCYGKRNDSYNTPEYKVIGKSIHANEQALIGKSHGGINFNPYIIDKDGKKQYYQRPLVWTLEQKQLLIDSIFNRIEIGKFIFRYKSWEELSKEMIETGHGFDYECIDGKQRYHAILEYIQNKFPNQDGIYFEDLSPEAIGEFLCYDNLVLGKLSEDSTSEDILRTFLTINFTGTQMSESHLEYVKSIKL